jgi:stress-induced-phosphoprotein 1
MADPEIQAILRDPKIQVILKNLQSDPRTAYKAFRDPEVMEKLNKLIASGILKMS